MKYIKRLKFLIPLFKSRGYIVITVNERPDKDIDVTVNSNIPPDVVVETLEMITGEVKSKSTERNCKCE